jgi:hypothetical protein
MCTVASPAIAQLTAENLPDAPTVAMLSEVESTSAFLRSGPVPVKRPVEGPRWYKKPANQVAIVLAAAEALDAIGTHENMTHSLWLCGYDPQLGTTYRIGGSTYQPNDGAAIRTFTTLCGPSPSGPNGNYVDDVMLIDKSFTEGGWAARFVNNRNYAGVEFLNIALDGAGLAVGRLIPNRGKMRWVKAIVMAVNYAHSFGHVYDGIQNIQFVHDPRQKADNFYEARSQAASYAGVVPRPRWWGKK